MTVFLTVRLFFKSKNEVNKTWCLNRNYPQQTPQTGSRVIDLPLSLSMSYHVTYYDTIYRHSDKECNVSSKLKNFAYIPNNLACVEETSMVFVMHIVSGNVK